jgi:ankyrin repeat protein
MRLVAAVAELLSLKAVGARFGEEKTEERLAIVEMLLSAGADVNAQRPRGGATPLLLAAAQDNSEIAERLIAAGADPEQEFDCKILKFPLSKPRTASPRTISAVSMARMRPRNKKIQRLLLGTE